jgi:hypothetical protein
MRRKEVVLKYIKVYKLSLVPADAPSLGVRGHC